jgi:hypothetical protein
MTLGAITPIKMTLNILTLNIMLLGKTTERVDLCTTIMAFRKMTLNITTFGILDSEYNSKKGLALCRTIMACSVLLG